MKGGVNLHQERNGKGEMSYHQLSFRFTYVLKRELSIAFVTLQNKIMTKAGSAKKRSVKLTPTNFDATNTNQG